MEIEPSVIDRLRASFAVTDLEDQARGQTAGETWAKEAATASALRQLKAERDEAGDHWGICFDPAYHAKSAGGSGVPVHQWLCSLAQNDELTAHQSETFWRRWLPRSNDHHRPGVLRGFADGAIAVWIAAEPLL